MYASRSGFVWRRTTASESWTRTDCLRLIRGALVGNMPQTRWFPNIEP